jgi:hypothetical protein
MSHNNLRASAALGFGLRPHRRSIRMTGRRQGSRSWDQATLASTRSVRQKPISGETRSRALAPIAHVSQRFIGGDNIFALESRVNNTSETRMEFWLPCRGRLPFFVRRSGIVQSNSRSPARFSPFPLPPDSRRLEPMSRALPLDVEILDGTIQSRRAPEP